MDREGQEGKEGKGKGGKGKELHEMMIKIMDLELAFRKETTNHEDKVQQLERKCNERFADLESTLRTNVAKMHNLKISLDEFISGWQIAAAVPPGLTSVDGFAVITEHSGAAGQAGA